MHSSEEDTKPTRSEVIKKKWAVELHKVKYQERKIMIRPFAFG